MFDNYRYYIFSELDIWSKRWWKRRQTAN